MKKVFNKLMVVLIVIASVFIVSCSNTTNEESGPITIRDMADREVTIPEEVDSIYSTGAIGTVMVYTLDDELVAGLNFELSDAEKSYTTEYYHNLPVLGNGLGEGKGAILEEIIKIAPDIVLVASSISNDTITSADELQEQINIPVVVVDSDLFKSNEAYTLLGEITGMEERAKELGDYCKEKLDEIEDISASIKEEDKVSVYYAEGPLGLQTDPSGSMHTEVLDIIGGINVAQVEIAGGKGKTEVSLEQVLSWNPEFIIGGSEAGFAANSIVEIPNDPAWQSVQAVKDGHVYQIPFLPTGWFDRPPTVVRVMGCVWLGNLIYPDYYDYDVVEETKEFYKLFYQQDLTQDDLDTILENAIRK